MNLKHLNNLACGTAMILVASCASPSITEAPRWTIKQITPQVKMIDTSRLPPMRPKPRTVITNITLEWTSPYTGNTAYVFNVWATTNLLVPLKLIATVRTNRFTKPTDKPAEFLTVTASNVFNRLESAYATDH